MQIVKFLSHLTPLKTLTHYSTDALALGVCVGISASSASTLNAVNVEKSSYTSQWQQIENSGKNQDVCFHA